VQKPLPLPRKHTASELPCSHPRELDPLARPPPPPPPPPGGRGEALKTLSLYHDLPKVRETKTKPPWQVFSPQASHPRSGCPHLLCPAAQKEVATEEPGRAGNTDNSQPEAALSFPPPLIQRAVHLSWTTSGSTRFRPFPPPVRPTALGALDQ
jgi:hypothetical protein